YNSNSNQTYFDQKGCLFPIRFLGDVKQSPSRLYEGPSAHYKPLIIVSESGGRPSLFNYTTISASDNLAARGFQTRYEPASIVAVQPLPIDYSSVTRASRLAEGVADYPFRYSTVK